MAYHYKDGQSPGSYSPSDEQYHYQYYHNYSTYPTPDHASYPPQAPPPLPGSAVPPIVHHHGGGSHGSDSPGGNSVDKVNAKSESKSDDEGEAKTTAGDYATATPTTAMMNPQYYYYSNGYDPYVQVLPAKADGGSESKSDDEGASGKTPGDYASPAVAVTAAAHPHYHYYGSVPANGNRGLYYGHPPPLPPAPAPASTVSPGDLARESAAAVYRDSPYYSDAPNLGAGGSGSSESSGSSSAASATAANANASGRPVPAKSAFMCFSESKGKASVEAVAMEWKRLSKRERARWEGMAKKDKARFAEEREAYTGPLARKLRTKKNPRAPKRPMSAFLMYAQVKRRVLQRENPDMPNADISRLLGEVWRNTSMAEKRPFLEREEAERKIYKAKMEAFKSNEKLAKSMQKVSKAKASFGSKKTATDHRCGNRAECHPASAGSPYEYKYNDFNWASTYGHQASPNPIKYTYPRPESK